METIEQFFILLLGIQFFHSIEELSTDFHRKFPLGKMKFRTFFIFEVIFFASLLILFFYKTFEYRVQLMGLFNILMFANGLWHMVWWGIEKKYVPGLITAPLFVVVFVFFYFKVIL